MISRLCTSLRTRTAARQRQGGGVAVEFALVLPLVITLLLGTVTAGVAYSRALGVTNAVREGARFGATTVKDGSWGSKVVTRTRDAHFDPLSSATQICAQLVMNTSAAPAVPSSVVASSGPCTLTWTPTPPPVEASRCVAMVWAARDFEIDTGMLPPFTGTIQRQSVSRYEREC